MFDGMQSGMGAGGWIVMSLLWVAVLAVVVWAIARVVPGRRETAAEPAATQEEPLTILDRRLARGEIDTATYDELRSKLSGPAPVGSR
jgi:putative membrane protein